MLIPVEFINKARELDACEDACGWLKAEPRRTSALSQCHIAWATWGFRIPGFPELLSDEQFDECRRYDPSLTLRFCSARLSDQQFDEYRRECPAEATRYCSDRLSDEQFDECRSVYPGITYIYCPKRCRARDLATLGIVK